MVVSMMAGGSMAVAWSLEDSVEALSSGGSWSIASVMSSSSN